MIKSDFIEVLHKKTQYTIEECTIINDVLENHFIFRKKNKPIVVAEIAQRLSVEEDEADTIYELCMSIIHAEKQRVLRHPFGSDKK